MILIRFDSPSLPSTAWPGSGHVCSAHSQSVLPESPRVAPRVRHAPSSPPPPHFGATTCPRPLPPLHHLYRPVLSEGLMSPAPPPRRLLPSPEPPRPRSPSPPWWPWPLFGPPLNKSHTPVRRVPLPGPAGPFPVPSPTLSQSEGPCEPPLPLPTRTLAPGTK